MLLLLLLWCLSASATPPDLAALWNEAVSAREAELFGEALDTFEAILQHDTRPQVVALACWTALQADELASAERWCDLALAQEPNWEAHVNRGHVDLLTGSLPAAILHYQQAMALSPALEHLSRGPVADLAFFSAAGIGVETLPPAQAWWDRAVSIAPEKDALLAEAQAHVDAAGEAAELAEEANAELHDTVVGLISPDRVDSHHDRRLMRAKVQAASPHYEAAILPAQRVVRHSEELYGPDHPLTWSARFSVGIAAARAGGASLPNPEDLALLSDVAAPALRGVVRSWHRRSEPPVAYALARQTLLEVLRHTPPAAADLPVWRSLLGDPATGTLMTVSKTYAASLAAAGEDQHASTLTQRLVDAKADFSVAESLAQVPTPLARRLAADAYARFAGRAWPQGAEGELIDATAHLRWGTALLSHRPSDAVAPLKRARELFAGTDRRQGDYLTVDTLDGLATALTAAGDLDAAHEVLHALDLHHDSWSLRARPGVMAGDVTERQARLAWAQDRHEAAGVLWRQAVARDDAVITRLLSGSTSAMLDGMDRAHRRAGSWALAVASEPAAGSPMEVYDAILRRKGAVLDVLVARRRLAEQRDDPELDAARSELDAVRRELVQAVISGGRDADITAAAWMRREADAEARVAAESPWTEATLRGEATLLSEDFRRIGEALTGESSGGVPDATWVPGRAAEVLAALPDDATLVEWVVTPALEPGGDDQLVALVARADALSLTHLGPMAPVADRIERWRRAVTDPTTTESQVRTLGEAVVAAVLSPLELGDPTVLYSAPDGALARVSFAALPWGERYLVEAMEPRRIASGLALLASPETGESGPALVIGHPDYGEPTQGARLHRWPPLPATETEARAVARRLRARLLLAEDARESALRQADSPAVLHVATHGFFLGGAPVSLTGGRSLVAIAEEGPPPTTPIHPLLTSGIVLAGANEPGASADDDGILTALELSDLDLRGTRLAVLSACETGLGHTRPGEGVFGLERALNLAGVDHVVMSLWSVPDAETADLMTRFHRIDEHPARALAVAMRRVVREQRRRRGDAHPWRWGAFVAAGR